MTFADIDSHMRSTHAALVLALTENARLRALLAAAGNCSEKVT